MQNKRVASRIILIILLVLLLAAVIFLTLIIIKDRISKTLSPFQFANDRLSTQVSQLLHPTPTVIPDPVTIIREVQAVAKLETIHYTVEKVVTAETSPGMLEVFFGDKLLFVGHGYVIAGLDMSKIDEADLWLQDGSLHVRLPKAEIFVATLDNEKSYVYDREVGILRDPDPGLETLARQVAEEEIFKAALEDGILEQARINGEVFLLKFFNSMGYESVVFELPGR